MPETIVTKQCSTCKQIKPLSEFYKHKGKKDGLQSQCKSCKSIYSAKYYRSECGETILKRSKKYQQTEKGKAGHSKSNKKYSQTEKGLAASRQSAKRQSQKYPERVKAGNAVNNAIAAGKMPRAKTLKCACGEQAKDYHHENYAPENRLKVIALCRQCHTAIHNIPC